MNQGLIDNWNSVVKKDDIVWHLGDWFFQPNRKKEEIKQIIKQLNGEIYTCLGNHCKKSQLIEFGLKEENIFQKAYLVFDGIKFLLNHFPYPIGMKEEDKTERPYAFKQEEYENGKIIPLLCGHVHWHWRIKKNCYNVGVDVNNWFPISENDIIDIYNKTEGFTTNLELYNV